MNGAHKPWTNRLWSPYSTTRYITSLQVIEKPEKESKDEEQTDVPRVPFGFSRVLEDS